jgi:tRNA pseudouridine32 synthase / 23S rRNA pseudouridine746 synthase
LITLPDDFIAPECLANIEILYQDEYLLIINKPSGLLSLSGKNPLNFDSVHYRLKQDFPTALLAHRLDFGTSGILLIALNKTVNANICLQFSQRTVLKTYEALLVGHVPDDAGEICVGIAKDVENFPLQKVCLQTGKDAISHYQVLERITSPCISRVLFTPWTGRTHQLRVHSQYFGHSILGCDLYATKTVQNMAPRLMLHACSIEFDHPVSGQRIRQICPAPF